MKISTYPHGRAMVVTPREAIVESDTGEVRHAVAEAVANGSSQIVLDFSEVPFIDSAGLELLGELQTLCGDSGAHLKLAALEDVCAEILRITDLAQKFQTFESVEEAVKGLA